MSAISPIGSIIQFITAGAALSVVALLWKNRKASDVAFLIMIEINVAVWAFFYASEFSTPVLNNKIIWSQLSYLGIAFLPVNFLFFILSFGQHSRFVNIRNYLLASIIPLATIVMVITNPMHDLVWQSISLPAGSNIMYYVHGPWFWIFWGYAFFLIGLSLLFLIRLYFAFDRAQRSQITILLLASLIPITGNLAYVTGVNPYPGFDWTTSCFVLTGLIIAIGVYHHHMFEIMPLATKELIKALNDGFIVINDRGLIEDLNPAARQIFDMNGNQIIKSSYFNVFQKYDDLIKIIGQDEECIADFQIIKNNDIRYYLVKTLPIRNKKKLISGKLVLFNDVTSIRRSEVKLKARNQQLLNEIKRNEILIADLDAFSHTVAHDLKNLLGAIYSSNEMVIDHLEAKDLSVAKDFSILIRSSTQQMINVTNELLKLATTGYQEIEIAPVDMQKVFELAKDQLKDIITEKNAQIEIVENWKTVKGYGPWLTEVWVNYLSNAIKYGGSPPLIKVGSKTLEDGRIKFWIRDNGDGIAPEYHSTLFEKHSRFHQDKALGYGLGLSIAKRIIEKMNGTVGVESTGEKGQGAEFCFILPSN